MKRLVTISLSIMVFFLAFSNIKAQEHHETPPQPDPAHFAEMMKHLSSELKLSKAQQADFDKISSKHLKEVTQVFEDGKMEHDQHKKEMDALKVKFESQLSEILTAEQRLQFESMQKADDRRRGICVKKNRKEIDSK